MNLTAADELEKAGDGVSIVGFPVGLVVYMIIFTIGFSFWAVGTVRRMIYRRNFFVAQAKAKAKATKP